MTGSQAIEEAFRRVPRAAFLPPEVRAAAALDQPLPIGYGQTNSQPSTVAAMLQMLNVQPGDRVLDVGAGSGWTTALLAQLIGKDGSVIGVELVPELAAFGQSNLRRNSLSARAEIRLAEAGVIGYPPGAPYDRILVSAAATGRVPEALIDQLAPAGKLVTPVDSMIVECAKSAEGEVACVRHPGYRFVPLITTAGS